MHFIDSPTERTTAATDLILALLALGCALYLWSIVGQDPWKANLWAGTFSLLALSAALGAVAHGFKMSKKTNDRFWQALNLGLGLTIALFVAGVSYDVWGQAAAQTVLPVVVVIGILFFGVTRLIPGSFFVFIVYQAIAMLFALGAYGWLAVGGQLDGASLMVAGVLMTLIAAGIQASERVSLTLIWRFDHNGIYHLIQMGGVLLLFAGLRAAL